MSVLRTWICKNQLCAQEFDSWESNPACPQCECVRVEWCPRGGHIAGISKGADAEFRALTEAFKMTDLHSAARDERAKPKLVQRPVDSQGAVHDFGGFAARIDPSVGAQCVPTANNVNVKASLGVGNKLGPGALGLPSVQSATTFDASHRGK